MSISINKLDNGLTVSCDTIDTIETVSVHVLVKAGSRNETASNNGVSHFLEHMAFKGTNTRTAKDIADEFDSIGAHFNAYTSREKTVYYAKVLKDDAQTAVDILSDIVQNSILPEDELEREREVILQEIAMNNDTPDELVFDYFQDVAYPNQPFGRTVLGAVDVIQKIGKADLQAYIDERYSQSNIIVSAAGNIHSDAFKKLVSDRFTTLPTREVPKTEAARYEGGDFRLQKDLEQVQFVLGFDGVSYFDPLYYTQQVLATIAGGSMSSRLNQEVREKRGLAYSIFSFGSSFSDNGMFGVYAGTTDDKVNELVDVVCVELKKLTDGITEEELKRAKAQVKTGLLMSQESSVSRAEKLAGNLAIFGKYIPVNDIIEKINAIQTSDIVNFAEKILTRNTRPTVASLGKIDKLYKYEEILEKLS